MSKPLPHADLVQHAAFLRRLGRQLLLDREASADAEQDAMVVGLERGPRDPRAARGWLAQVFRNAARQRYRGRTRRSAREHAVAVPEALESTADAVVRREVIRRVAHAVLALPEPYREVVVLRYYENLPPRRIAERLDAPVATVKSRLGRALGRLRERLDATDRQGAASWRTGLAPLAGLEESAGQVGAALATGGAIVKTKTLIATTLLLVAGGGYAAYSLVADEGEVATVTESGALPAAPTDRADSPGSPSVPARQSSAPPRPPPPAAPRGSGTPGPVAGAASPAHGGSSPSNAAILDETLVSLTIRDQTVTDVIKTLSIQTGNNLLISPLAREAGDARIAELKVEGATLRTALDLIQTLTGLFWTQLESGTVVFHADK